MGFKGNKRLAKADIALQVIQGFLFDEERINKNHDRHYGKAKGWKNTYQLGRKNKMTNKEKPLRLR